VAQQLEKTGMVLARHLKNRDCAAVPGEEDSMHERPSSELTEHDGWSDAPEDEEEERTQVHLSTDVAQDDTVHQAEEDLEEGKAPSTAAGEFVREEIEHVREGKHGARSPKQAIAIGLSKARRAGVPLPAPKKGQTSERTRRAAERELSTSKRKKPSGKRSKAALDALKREPRSTVSKQALAKQARSAAKRRKTSAAATTQSASKKRPAKRAARKATSTKTRGGTTRRASPRKTATAAKRAAPKRRSSTKS
jgi:hypothetical protein